MEYAFSYHGTRAGTALLSGALTLITLVAAPAGAQVLSSKRGFADVGANYTNLQATGAGWYYTWGLGDGNPGNFDATHAPMFWGGWAVNQGNIDAVKNNPDVEWVLGFNEPERTDQANMSVAQAISSWTTLSNGFAGSGKKLVSPAVSDTSGGKAWMSDFMTQANNAGLQVDAVAFHWYGWSSPSNPSQAASNFIGSMNWYHQWGLPVFVTEFAIHDWGGAYTDAEISEANRQFLDIVVPWMESTSWVQGYAWYHWFGDAHLYEGSPPTPTQMGYDYIGVIRNGETYDFSGIDHGEHVAFLANGTLTHNGAGGTLRYVNALEGTNQINGSTDWGLGSGWVRVQPGATLRKTGTNQVTFNATSVDNQGTVEVAGGTLRLENNVAFIGGGNLRVKSGGTVTFHGVRDIDSATLNYDVELAGGTVDGTSAMVQGLFVDNGATLSGHGTVGAKLTARTGSTIRIGGAGLPSSEPELIDNFDSYNNSTNQNIGAHANGDATAGVWDGVFDGTNNGQIVDNTNPADNALVAFGVPAQGSGGWRGAVTDLTHNFTNDFGLADGDTATYFFQVMNEGNAYTDTMIGLTENLGSLDINNAWQDYAVRPIVVGGPGSAQLSAGGSLIATLTDGLWQNVWVVVDNAGKTYDVYTSTGTNDGSLALSNVSFGPIAGAVNLEAFGITNREDGRVRIDNLYMILGESTTNPLAGLGPITYNPEVLTVDGDVVLQTGATVIFDIATDGINDLLSVTGNLTAGGTLEVVLDGSAPALSLGDQFDILDFASAGGAFDNFSLPALGAGLTWDTSNLLTTGVLEIVSSLLEGDLDGDGFVGIADLNIVLGNWNQSVTAGDLLQGDPTGDGFVGIGDLNIVLGNWNASAPPAQNANIPEPMSLFIMGLGGMLLCTRRRR